MFFDDEDRHTYLDLLAAAASQAELAVLGFCLMTNHVHLITVPAHAGSMTLALRYPAAKWQQVLGLGFRLSGDLDRLRQATRTGRPYGDVYMKIAEPFRRRGLGAYLVQELKAICRDVGSIPAACCQVNNVASRRTLQAAGFVPCGNLVVGEVGPRD